MSQLTIAFVGQCHTVGYPGVPPDAAFPRVCQEVVQASRPGTRVRVKLQPYYHPSELTGAVRAALRHKPRVVVVEVVGWLAVAGTAAVDLSRLPPAIRSAYERIRHFRSVSRVIARNVPLGPDLIYRAQTNVVALSTSVLRTLLPRYPRPSVAEYEICVTRALALVQGCEGIAPVVQGPGAPNLSLETGGLPADTIERYRAVNAMARRVAAASDALYVDRWDTIGRDFYRDDSPRPSASGHSVWGHLLAAQLLSAGVV
jgi:hypothetical protein